MSDYTDDQLIRIIDKMGKDMCAGSSPRNGAMEKDRIILVKELMKRGLGGYASKKKYRFN